MSNSNNTNREYVNTDMNNVSLSGYVTRAKYFEANERGGSSLRLNVAVHDDYRTDGGEVKKQTYWIELVCYGKRADGLKKVANKAGRIAFTGKLTNPRTWTGDDGTVNAINVVRMDQLEIMSWKADGAGDDMPEFNGSDTDQIPF